MKVSLSWLSTYVPIEMEVQRLADRLTMAGLEVDSVTDRYDYLDTVVVGCIAAVHPHPQAERLKLCEVETGRTRRLHVVCGASNAAEGRLAPLALPGTRLPDGTQVETGSIRGQRSEGMLCSEVELGLGGDSAGIMVLDSRLTPGSRLADALNLSDAVMEFDLTPNRPDCLSFFGIAREAAAIQNTRVVYPRVEIPSGRGNIADYTRIQIEASDHCPRYAARLLTDVTVGPSPQWLQQRLLSIGQRPINNIVDVTNFVMLETGQPLHAFDFDNLAEQRIVVRLAAEGEPFTTLDQKERRLSATMLMICDGLKPVAVGGVMGGLNSEIEAGTQRVLIESAYFAPDSIRRTSKRLGLKTEASHRFERGVDPHGTVAALDRAAQLMVAVSGAVPVDGVIDAHPAPVARRKIFAGAGDINRLLGTRIPRTQMQQLLESIEFSVTAEGDEALRVVPPSCRVDIERPVDIAEEVARLAGYDGIPTTFPMIPAKAKPLSPARLLRDRIRRSMTGLGFTEVINYSFISGRALSSVDLPEDDPRRREVALMNPLSEDQRVMRTSLLPGLIANLQRNQAQQVRTLKIFEVGKVFFGRQTDELPLEVEMFNGLWSGLRQPEAWCTARELCDFFDLKGAVEGLLESLNISDPVFTRLPDAQRFFSRPGSTARILIDGTEIGWVGELSPRLAAVSDLKQTAFIFEINLDVLAPLVPEQPVAAPLPKFPAVARDVTLIVDKAVESRNIIQMAQDRRETLVEAVQLFDVYEGAPIPAAKKSISFRIIYRSDRETLSDAAVNHVHQRISERLIRHFDADLPG